MDMFQDNNFEAKDKGARGQGLFEAKAKARDFCPRGVLEIAKTVLEDLIPVINLTGGRCPRW